KWCYHRKVNQRETICRIGGIMLFKGYVAIIVNSNRIFVRTIKTNVKRQYYRSRIPVIVTVKWRSTGYHRHYVKTGIPVYPATTILALPAYILCSKCGK